MLQIYVNKEVFLVNCRLHELLHAKNALHKVENVTAITLNWIKLKLTQNCLLCRVIILINSASRVDCLVIVVIPDDVGVDSFERFEKLFKPEACVVIQINVDHWTDTVVNEGLQGGRHRFYMQLLMNASQVNCRCYYWVDISQHLVGVDQKKICLTFDFPQIWQVFSEISLSNCGLQRELFGVVVVAENLGKKRKYFVLGYFLLFS